MQEIGIRELKAHVTEVVRSVREDLEEFVVTSRGVPVAILRPLTEADTARFDASRREGALLALDALAVSVAEKWCAGSATDAIDEQRR